ncbi:MAG TPA: DUF5691 domain-containing protein [Prolixibacteraceae bacterium]|jgi:hypothetical protein|nr:DUF5691 domain-containing protein [Prolixibacteraceae bacterium]
MWQYLIETALLGTGKKNLNTENLIDDINQYSGKTFDDKEDEFLKKSVLTYFYLEAGRCPSKLKAEPELSVIEEVCEIAPDELISTYLPIESLSQKLKEKLLNSWLDVLVKNKWIVSPEVVLKLLELGNSFSKGIKLKIVKVIGNKGNMILPMFSGYNGVSSLNSDQVWLEGSTSDRKELLDSLLEKQPERAIALLQSTWAQESVTNKRFFIELLSERKSEATIQFAETLYDNEFSYREKEKKTEKECRRILAKILLSSDTSELYRFTKGKLLSYVMKEKRSGLLKLLSSKSQPDYQLPENEDSEFWNGFTMEKYYGLEVQHYDIAKFNTIVQYWFSELLMLMPANIWINEAFESYTELFNCLLFKDLFKIKIDGNMVPVFFNALYQNAISFADNQLSLAMIPRIPANIAIPLLKNLTQSQFEQYVQTNNFFGDEGILSNGPFSIDSNWSISFTENVLRQIFEIAMQSQYSNLSSLADVVAQLAPLDITNTLNHIEKNAVNNNLYHSWKTSFYDRVVQAIEIRKSIIHYNN